jgi:tetratricopeptide (TPR) repeat protein
LGIAGWPFALKNPLNNTIESFRVMAAFPDTFRQIFMGKVEWSDYMPWYYLPVSMAVTIPLAVSAGLVLFAVFIRQIGRKENRTAVSFLAFTVIFPVFYAIAIKANVYSSWRHFLFVYPAIIILASLGMAKLWEQISGTAGKLVLAVLLLLLCWHPASFIVRNTPYAYLYYNQITGGLIGANGKFETDYYFVSQKEACEKLENYLVEKGDTSDVTVAANFSVEWYFRKYRGIKTVYVRHRERSMKDWDYLVMTNRYIDPFQLKNNIWPPDSTLFTVTADGVTLGAVVKKEERYSLKALNEFSRENYLLADSLYRRALLKVDDDEMIFYNFAAAVAEEGKYSEADSLLEKALSVNPGFDLAMMFRGILAGERGEKDVAEKWYRKTIACNRKFFEAYTALAELVGERSKKEARQVLLDCLSIKPDWKPAVEMMADLWREERPDISKKYEEIAKSLNN